MFKDNSERDFQEEIYNKETKKNDDIEQYLSLSDEPKSQDSNSINFDELFKRPEAPPLRKLASYVQLPSVVLNEVNFNLMLNNLGYDENENRFNNNSNQNQSQKQDENNQQDQFQQQPATPNKQIAQIRQTAPQAQSEQLLQQTPPQYKISLRSTKPEKKPVKFSLSDESGQSPTTGSVRSNGPQAGLPCHCTKTQCLKLYCSCFHNNRLCTSACICVECHNTQAHVDQRKGAIDYVRSKGVRAHEIDKFDTSTVWGCKCRKTQCLKRYCECYIRGKKCTSHCKCDDCQNRRLPQLKKKIKHQNVKVQKTES